MAMTSGWQTIPEENGGVSMLRSWRVMYVIGISVGVLLGSLMISLQAAQAQSGGAIVVNVRAGGRPATAEVVIKSAGVDPVAVAKGRSGSPISVPPGTYDVEITCTELLDHPVQELRDVVVSGETVEREAVFPAGTVTLHVKQGGRVLKNANLVLIKVGGEALPGKAKTGEPFRASPGQYEAEISLGRGRSKMAHSITGIQVYYGATRNIPVSL